MVEKIMPGLYRIVLPLSGNPLREINSFVFTSPDRNLIVDTGMNRDECREAIESGLDSIGIDLERTDIIATHYHADHQGLVATLLKEGSRAFMGELDAAAISGDHDYWTESGPMGRLAVKAGFPGEVLRASLKNHPGFKDGPKESVDYVGLKDGDSFPIGDFNLTVVTTPGHTGGHICLHEPTAKFLISGDHILGDITPNLQAWGYDEDPLGDFESSLERTRKLDIDLCLPGHRSLIENCSERIDELLEHHRDRADEVVSILRDEPLNAYDIAGRMSWDIRARSWEEFPIMQRWFATGEAIAHIRYLEKKGLIERRSEGELDIYMTSN
ncbi:MAG: MBL fold metallo-hydrolase [bacterium]|nr:MBL fold metallo-hydrolase [bacterium]